MRLALKYIKKMFIVTFFIAFMFFAKKAREYVFAADGCSCNFDNIISCSHKSKIFNFINLDKELKICSLKNISEKIKEKFCVIKDLEVSQVANGILSLNIFSLEPKFVLNDNYVLAENKTIFDKNLFAKEALENCKPVIIGNLGLDCVCSQDLQSQDFQAEVTESCKNMIFGLQEKYFRDYEITRESSAKSYMLDKINKNFCILFNDNIIPDDKILAYCLYIKNELAGRGEFKTGEFKKKEPKNWFADIRFKDQIVLFNKVRGR